MSESTDRVYRPWGAGMPALLHLHAFGDLCELAFDAPVYLVGSSLETKRPRDVDVRVQITDSAFQELIGPMETYGKPGTRWAALCMAFSALGRQMTGRPIDFQIQATAHWLPYEPMPRFLLRTVGGDR